jgi:hypothetical protein
MTDTTKILLGLGVGVVLLGGAIILYQTNKPKPKPHPDADENEYMTENEDVPSEEQSSVAAVSEPDNSEMELLQKRIELLKIRDNFKDSRVEGYEEYMQKTKDAIQETHDKNLVFYVLEDKYIIADFNNNIKAEAPKEAA